MKLWRLINLMLGTFLIVMGMSMCASGTAMAETSDRLMFPTISYHFDERDSKYGDYNERNWGIGVKHTYVGTNDYKKSAYIMTYKNSYSMWATVFGLGDEWALGESGWHAGYSYGVVAGYKDCRPLCPWVMGSLAYENEDGYGVTVWGLPSVVVGMSFTIPLGD